MRLLNIYYKYDSSEHPFISTIIWGTEIHLSQIFMINVFNFMESSVSAETSVATLGVEMGPPVAESISGYLALVAVYLGKFSSETDT